MNINIPKERTVKICEAERFAIGLRQLFEECGVAGWSLTTTDFKDGSSIGNRCLAEYALGRTNKLYD